MVDFETPKEKPAENPELAANTIRQQLDRALTSLQGFAKENKEGAQKVIDQIHATFQEKSGELQKMKEDVSAQLKTKYTEVANFAKNKMGLTDIPLTVEDLQKKFNQNIVSFSKNPLGNVGGFFKETFNKIPIPNWFKNMTGLGTPGEIADNVGRMGKRLYFNFLLGVDKMVPAFMAPLFGGMIDSAREGMILMDAEDGLRNAVKALEKRDNRDYDIAWDELTWEKWRPAFDTAKSKDPTLTARIFVERHVKAKLGGLPIATIEKMTMEQIPLPEGAQSDTALKPAPASASNLEAWGLKGWASNQERPVTGEIMYKTMGRNTNWVVIRKDEIDNGGTMYKIKKDPDVQMVFKPVLVNDNLYESELLFTATRDGKVYTEKIRVNDIAPKTIGVAPMQITFEK